MNEISFPVYPNIKETINIVKLTINVLELKLFEYVNICVTFYDEKERIVSNKIFTIDKTNGYDSWGSDDNFIGEWVKKELKLGLYS